MDHSRLQKSLEDQETPRKKVQRSLHSTAFSFLSNDLVREKRAAIMMSLGIKNLGIKFTTLKEIMARKGLETLNKLSLLQKEI